MSGRGGPFGAQTPVLGDAQIFFTAVLGMAGVLLCGELLAELVATSTAAAYGPALLSRIASSPQTVRWIYAFFILLPASLAVLAIGFPFFLRTLIAAIRRRLRRNELFGFILMMAAFAGLGLELSSGGDGTIATSAAGVIALWQSGDAIGERGASIGDRLLMTTGAVLLGLVHYERQLLAGAEPSLAVAPTLLVAAFFFGAAGLLISTVATLRRGAKGRGRMVLSWIALAYWASSPQMRRLAVATQEADSIEVASTAVAGALLLVTSVAAEFGRRKAERGRYHIAAAD